MSTIESELTVVVSTHNRAELVDQALASLSEQSWDGHWDVLVVDNDSTDHTATVLQRWTDNMPVPMSVVHASDAHGPSYARNTGAERAIAPGLAFVDDDDCVGDGWVAAIGNALRSHQLVGSRFNYTSLNSHELATTHTVNVERLPDMNGTPVVAGGGMACHRSLWLSLGGNDIDLRYGEDIDFSLRASAIGVDPTFCSDAEYQVRLRDGALAAFRRGRQHGRASVSLHVSHGAALGEEPDRFSLLARVWAGYLMRIPRLFGSRDQRLIYAEQLGRRIGRLRGSWDERCWFP